ncbi:hypothetical protein ACVXG7_18100 [Enterobacter hormaechei]
MFIDGLALPEQEKARLKAMTPESYIGFASQLVDKLDNLSHTKRQIISAFFISITRPK